MSAPVAAAGGAPAAQQAAPAKGGTLTPGQQFLAGAAILLQAALAPVFFTDMFVTVNGMLGPSFGFWAWTVPVATELTFILLLVLAILFEWMRRPVPALWKLPYLFAGLSAFMNVWAANGSVAGIGGHLAVTAAFFVPLGFAKTTVRKLIVTAAERARAQALADARAHAKDVLRSALGVFWRQRTPMLLRRQLRSGRLPAAVMAAVASGDAASLERSVEAWITAAVMLPERFAGVLAAARAEASHGTPGATSGSTAAGIPGSTPAAIASGTAAPAAGTPGRDAGSVPQGTPPVPRGATQPPPQRAPGGTSRGSAGRHARIIPSKASDDELAALVVPLLAAGPVSKYRVIEAVRDAAGGKGKPSIGDKRAGEVLALARERAARDGEPG